MRMGMGLPSMRENVSWLNTSGCVFYCFFGFNMDRYGGEEGEQMRCFVDVPMLSIL